MSHINYDFLVDSLFWGQGLENNYSDYSDDDIHNELTAYRKHVLNNIESIRSEILEDKRKIKVTVESFGNRPNEDTLKQLALYMDCVLIDDPLFRMTEPRSKSTEVMSRYLGMKSEGHIDRATLVAAINYMKNNTRLIVCDFLKFIPLSILHEAPTQIPIVHDENQFSSSMPNHIHDFLIDNMDVRNIVRTDNGIQVKLKDDLKIDTGLYLYFPECEERNGEIAFYQEMENVSTDGSKSDFRVRLYVPEKISKTNFDNWLIQSKNRAALEFMDETVNEYMLACDLGAMYLTKSKLRSDLLSMMYDVHSTSVDVANLSMGLKLPVLYNVGIDDVIEIRENYGESFKNFRTFLGEQLTELCEIDDSEELARKLSILSYTINESSIGEIDDEINGIKSSMGIDIAVTIGSLITSYAGSVNGSVAGNAIALGTLATGAFSVLKDTKDTIKKYVNLRRKPGFFLWKIENKSWNESMKLFL